ncbi:Transcriptional regulator ATRX -like protein [Sarcoptes scabiei]|uniref:Transcriptional regulator ATRX -like protein n=1 Tax=Sarcoptes scabiei TaxID=52283 RepID=A0A834R3V9_SARSC|nr:Transcriptional regulator ATRX -like protein [Sarcoptes scabiei]
MDDQESITEKDFDRNSIVKPISSIDENESDVEGINLIEKLFFDSINEIIDVFHLKSDSKLLEIFEYLKIRFTSKIDENKNKLFTNASREFFQNYHQDNNLSPNLNPEQLDINLLTENSFDQEQLTDSSSRVNNDCFDEQENSTELFDGSEQNMRISDLDFENETNILEEESNRDSENPNTNKIEIFLDEIDNLSPSSSLSQTSFFSDSPSEAETGKKSSPSQNDNRLRIKKNDSITIQSVADERINIPNLQELIEKSNRKIKQPEEVEKIQSISQSTKKPPIFDDEDDDDDDDITLLDEIINENPKQITKEVEKAQEEDEIELIHTQTPLIPQDIKEQITVSIDPTSIFEYYSMDDSFHSLHETDKESDSIDDSEEKKDISKTKSPNSNASSENKHGKFDEFNKLMKKVSNIIHSSDDSSEDIDSKSHFPVLKKSKAINQGSETGSSDEDLSDILKRKSKKNPSTPNKTDLSSDDGGESGEDNKSGDKTPKKRRRVIANNSSSSFSSSEDESKNKDLEDFNNPILSGSRKKIRKIIADSNLQEETRLAKKSEKERQKRIEEKQKLYNSIDENIAEKPSIERIVLDVCKETKKVLVEVDPKFIRVLKPHQVDGIKFMFDCTIETIERLKTNNHESGCILAHSMGLGKTLQVVAFLHTIMNNEDIKTVIRRVLIVVPLNVAKNWAAEFQKWFEECDIESRIYIYEIIKTKSLHERSQFLKRWNKTGGICIITINLFSQMIAGRRSKSKNYSILPMIKEYLIDPGPEMVIIDEGHLLKNDKTVFNTTINQIKTLRRIVLTGTPLQNNLSEYFIMVNFVKPNLLGTKKEFRNRFENPITNGQHFDSTEDDVKKMKKCVHILHKILQDVIHRCSYNVLKPYLKRKYEFVLDIRLTDKQIELYRYYLNNLSDKNGKNLLTDYSVLRLIWNHPYLLERFYEKRNEAKDSIKQFIVEDYASSEDDIDDPVPPRAIAASSSNSLNSASEKNGNDYDSDIECIFNSNNDDTTQRFLRSHGKIENVDHPSPQPVKDSNDWWKKILMNEKEKEDGESKLNDIELSSKLIILFSILEQCEILGDKVLVFSQSLQSLDIIEDMLEMKMAEMNANYGHDIAYDDLVNLTGGVSNRWVPNVDYLRIDGSVKSDNRSSLIDKFNDSNNYRTRLMLISTKAGGLGINLVGANRCIIFDVSWNPSHDLQAIYRIYRYGQAKPVYIYRFISYGTMERKIYDRQIIKQSIAGRVIDEFQIARHFKQSELAELYALPEVDQEITTLPDLTNDRLLSDLFLKHKNLIVSYHEHDSLLENRPEEDLTEEERKAAWIEYEKARDGLTDEAQLQNQLLQQSFLYNQFNNSFLRPPCFPNRRGRPPIDIPFMNINDFSNSFSAPNSFLNSSPQLIRPLSFDPSSLTPGHSNLQMIRPNSQNPINRFERIDLNDLKKHILTIIKYLVFSGLKKYLSENVSPSYQTFQEDFYIIFPLNDFDSFRIKFVCFLKTLFNLLCANNADDLKISQTKLIMDKFIELHNLHQIEAYVNQILEDMRISPVPSTKSPLDLPQPSVSTMVITESQPQIVDMSPIVPSEINVSNGIPVLKSPEIECITLDD